MKRFFLFALTNIAVVLTISVLLSVLGVQPYLEQNGINLTSLAAFCLIWGMTGSVISLLLSRQMAKWMLGVKVINPVNAGEYAWLVNMIEQISKSAGLPKSPEVGIYESAEVNAFATGPSKTRALVAFSTGILRSMNRTEIEGVAGHELAHIANGDMVTMTLIQGVVNAFVMFLARILAFVISRSGRGRSDYASGNGLQSLIVFVLQIIFGIVGSMITAWFSRTREFRADRGSAMYVGRDKMIAGLEVLKRRYQDQISTDTDAREPQGLATLKISGKSSGLMSLFATHPPLEDRIKALQSFSGGT